MKDKTDLKASERKLKDQEMTNKRDILVLRTRNYVSLNILSWQMRLYGPKDNFVKQVACCINGI